MSKYTRNDPDVLFLDTRDRIEYEFDLLKHNVEKNEELSWGMSAIKDPKNIKKKFKDPKKIGLAIIVVICFLLMIVLILMIIVYLIFYIKKVEWKLDLMKKIIYSLLLAFLILVIFYKMFNRMYEEMVMLLNLAKDKVKT